MTRDAKNTHLQLKEKGHISTIYWRTLSMIVEYIEGIQCMRSPPMNIELQQAISTYD